MVKNIPSPCCGEYGVNLVALHEDNGDIWYKGTCPKCGFTTSDSYDNKQEAIHEYETMCIATWVRNKNGLLDWMKKKPENGQEMKMREKIKEDVRPYLTGRYSIPLT